MKGEGSGLDIARKVLALTQFKIFLESQEYATQADIVAKSEELKAKIESYITGPENDWLRIYQSSFDLKPGADLEEAVKNTLISVKSEINNEMITIRDILQTCAEHSAEVLALCEQLGVNTSDDSESASASAATGWRGSGFSC